MTFYENMTRALSSVRCHFRNLNLFILKKLEKFRAISKTKKQHKKRCLTNVFHLDCCNTKQSFKYRRDKLEPPCTG